MLIVVGPLPRGRVLTGEFSATPCLPLGRVAPGRYRLRALEARISTFAALPRFLFPDPDDGYRIPGTRQLGAFTRYRVLVPATPAFEIEVLPGTPAVLGHVDVMRKPRATWGVAVRRVAGAPDQTCQDAGSSSAGSGATSTSKPAPPGGT